ncbi:MAG: DNA cytosine methyltransferase, partial [Pseudomonadota bacterium]
AEIRFDRAGCLRTPAGGSSKQFLVIARPDGEVDARWLTGREAARLMGLPDDYRLPRSESAALRLAGDGVAVPVVRWLAERALEPLLVRSLEPAAAAE